MNSSVNSCILFFVKYPQKGLVKSRLSLYFGEIKTLNIYKVFVEDLLQLLDNLQYHTLICYTPSHTLIDLQKWIGLQYSFVPQKGQTLGEKIMNSFLYSFSKGYTRAMVIGSDSPDLPEKYIHEGFDHLCTSDVVIGPSTDGGYYLLGLRQEALSPKIFEGIHWSTSTVFRETLKKLKEEKLTKHILPTWHDVDTKEDLYALYTRNKDKPFRKSRTMRLLSEYL